MPALILIVKKLLMFIICYWAGLLLAEGAVIGVMFACGKNFMQGEMFSDSVMNRRTHPLLETYRKKEAFRNGCD